MECIIAGGMGSRAQELFAESGVKTILGVSGSIDDVIKQIFDGTLKGGESLCEHWAGNIGPNAYKNLQPVLNE